MSAALAFYTLRCVAEKPPRDRTALLASVLGYAVIGTFVFAPRRETVEPYVSKRHAQGSEEPP
jgi:hypothetical protein